MKTQKIDTWLPVFSGFYGTIWETDHEEEREFEYINEHREQSGLKPISWDDVEWDYKGHFNSVAEGVTRYIGEELKKLGFISGYAFQELRSPREYNFANDSINVSFSLTKKNVAAIGNYLKTNQPAFEEYLKDKYTSRSGFFSSYSPDVDAWIGDLGATLAHGHMLGSVLNFILLNEDADIERDMCEHLTGNGYTVQAKNWSELCPATR